MNKIIQGDCLEELKKLPDNSVDSIVTDPPYELGFMGKSWDSTGIANNVELWKECLRVLKPGGHLLAFSGTRTYHRMACAIDDAGFEIRDMIEWVYGSGFPKSLNIGKAVDKIAEKNTELIERKFAFGRHIKEERLKAGITLKQLNETFGYVAGCNWWEAQKESNNRLITWNDWVKLKEIITTLDDKFVDLIEDRPQKWIEREREVIGKTIRGNAGFSNEQVPRPWKETIGEEMPITKGTSEWEGWGTALKPAHEPICMARKPLAEKTVAENCLKWGVGGINIDESRVEHNEELKVGFMKTNREKGLNSTSYGGEKDNRTEDWTSTQGRFPANLIHDNSEEVRECFPETGKSTGGRIGNKGSALNMMGQDYEAGDPGYGDSGNASRFFKSIIYQAKASKNERNKGCEGLEEKPKVFNGQSDKPSTDMKDVEKRFTTLPKANNHPTVKPIALMEYLIKMVTPKGGIVLDPFAGSGSTLVSAKENGYQYIGIERESEYINIINARLNN